VHIAVLEFHYGRLVTFDHPEQVALSPGVMTFTVEVLARRFTFLLP
jgi:hypothetical protein